MTPVTLSVRRYGTQPTARRPQARTKSLVSGTAMPSPSIRTLTFATVTIVALLGRDVVAQAKPDSVKPLKVTAGVAYLDASGNTDVTSLTVNERLEWKRPHYVWAQSANAINGSTDGEESANLLAIGV